MALGGGGTENTSNLPRAHDRLAAMPIYDTTTYKDQPQNQLADGLET